MTATAAGLSPGMHQNMLTFPNTTNGLGTATRTVTAAVQPGPGALAVTPASGLQSAGEEGGDFAPLSSVYTLTNTGTAPIDFSVTKTQPWTTVSPIAGALDAGSTVQVTVAVDPAVADTLTPGSYEDLVLFDNTTSGDGSTSRFASLLVEEPGVLAVTPSEAFEATRTSGGPFVPATKLYILTNTGETSLDFAVTPSQAWVSVTPEGGSIAPGERVQVTASFNDAASSVTTPTSGLIEFTNLTSDRGSTTRAASLVLAGLLMSQVIILPDHNTPDAEYVTAQNGFISALSALPIDGSVQLGVIYASARGVAVPWLPSTLLTPDTFATTIAALSKPRNAMDAAVIDPAAPVFAGKLSPLAPVASRPQTDFLGAAMAVSGATTLCYSTKPADGNRSAGLSASVVTQP